MYVYVMRHDATWVEARKNSGREGGRGRVDREGKREREMACTVHATDRAEAGGPQRVQV
jgi:hypothetical protein